MKRFGSPPRPGIAYTRRPGAYAIIWHDGRVLVTEETAAQIEIQLPGGGIDPGEGPVQALHREALEETGWSLRLVRRLGVYQRYTFMPDYGIHARKICHLYLCTPGLRLSAPTEAHHRALWMTPEEAIPQLASPGDAWYLSALVDGQI